MGVAATHGKEYFPSTIYGPASRRVVADGQPIPHGGGQYLVGKPYTIAGQTYVPSERRVTQVGVASWYGDAFHGRLTANGEVYDRDSFTAAHPTMPLPSYARVTNLANNYSMVVRVNDRGPYASNRIMDVSRRVAEALEFKRMGTARIKVEYVGQASLAGSDDQKLYATLRQGAPARWRDETPTMIAEAPMPSRTASLSPAFRTARKPARGEDSQAAPRATAEPTRRSHLAEMEEMPRREASRARPSLVKAEEAAAGPRTARFALASPAPLPPSRESLKVAAVALPPSRPAHLGALNGAGQLGRARGVGLRLARVRDDD